MKRKAETLGDLDSMEKRVRWDDVEGSQGGKGGMGFVRIKPKRSKSSFGPDSVERRERLMMDVEAGYMDDMTEMQESPSKRTKNISQGLIPQGQCPPP
jgi:hypothetical protein